MRCARVAALVSAAALLASSARAVAEPIGSKDSSAGGLVLGFGKVIDPPYEFSGLGTSILYLNGLQFFPTPAYSKELTIVVTPESAAQTLQRSEVRARAFSETAAISDVLQRLEAMAGVFRSSGLVSSTEVFIRARGLLVDWTGFAREWVSLDSPPPAGSTRNQEPMSPFESDSMVVSSQVQAQTKEMETLKQQALQRTEAIQDINARLAAMETIFRKSSIVTDVKTKPELKQISVTWTYIGVEHIQIASMSLLPTDESESQLTVQESRMQEFWTVVSGGHSVAFGDDYYIIGGSPEDARHTRRVLSSLMRGERVKKTELAFTLLKDKRILASVLEANHIPEEAIIE